MSEQPEAVPMPNIKEHLLCSRYGAVCFSDGYVAGVKAENARCRQILTDKRKHYDALPDRALAAQCFDHAEILLGGWAYEAALRGEKS